VAVLFSNITQRLMAEQDLRRLNDELAQANRRKTEFLATLAHELRNPLAPMRNAVHFLKLKGPATPDVQWASDIIDRQVQAMSHLIDDLMDISRINQGRIELRLELLQLDAVIADAVETIQPQIDGAGHKLSVLQPPGKLWLKADRTRLAQALMNLLSNAAKYTDPGGQIELHVVKDDGMAAISIRDTGIGIPPHRLESVFEMFSQEEAALSRSRGGLGIGLALTRKLAQMHGGTVTASSEGPGRGSQFTLRLPLEQDAHAEAEPAATPAMDVRPAGGLRILVADDNKDAAETLTMLLELMGHQVRHANDGDEAVRMAAEFDPQLVLLDIGMPKLNGYEVCRQLRSHAGGTARTIIAVTGWGQPHDLEKSHDAGFDHHLVKPVDTQRLLQLIAQRAEQH
jgi:CheY-like chemotaxis protein